jgi:hypothetical protein
MDKGRNGRSNGYYNDSDFEEAGTGLRFTGINDRCPSAIIPNGQFVPAHERVITKMGNEIQGQDHDVLASPSV